MKSTTRSVFDLLKERPRRIDDACEALDITKPQFRMAVGYIRNHGWNCRYSAVTGKYHLSGEGRVPRMLRHTPTKPINADPIVEKVFTVLDEKTLYNYEIAAKVKLPKSTVNSWRTGYRIPNIRDFEKLAAFAGYKLVLQEL